MFAMIRFFFYSSLAIFSGIMASTVSLGGKTLSDRVGEAWRDPELRRAVDSAGTKVTEGVREVAMVAIRENAPTLGKARFSETHSPSEEAAVHKLVASRSRGR